MPDHLLERRLVFGRPRAEVFRLLTDPRAPEWLSPRWLGVRLRAAPPELAPGAVLDYRAAGLLRWRVLVREFDPPYRVVDAHVRGPLTRWERRRRFLEVPEGTAVEDRIVYRMPLGALGRVLHAAGGRWLREGLGRARVGRLAALLGPAITPALDDA